MTTNSNRRSEQLADQDAVTGKPNPSARESLPVTVPERPVILVVDDEPDYLGSITDILHSRGYECLTASTLREAAEKAAEHRPDLCLLDLRLPDGNGLELLERLRTISPVTETVIMTGYASLPTAVRAINLGAFSYLEKPCNVDRLFLTLEKALEHQRLVQTLERSESVYSQLLNATGALTFSVAPATWRLNNISPGFYKLLGYDETCTESLTLDQLLPDAERPPVIKMLTELSKASPAQTRNLTFETALLHRNRTPFWFSVSATRIPRSVRRKPASVESRAVDLMQEMAGQPADNGFDLLLVCTDISGTRRAVAELEQTKNFIESVFAVLPCGVAIIGSDYQIIDANPAYCRPLGMEPGYVRRRFCYEVFSRYSTQCSMYGELCPITAARTTGALGRVYREHRLPDGRVRNLEYTASPLYDEHRSITGFVLVLNDLTHLRETEERLEQAKVALENLNSELRLAYKELEENTRQIQQANVKLLKLSNAKSEFVAAVSHELRTPLTAIAEGIALVEDGSLGALNTEQKNFLRLARNNTKRLADLINDLLDLSKIEAGKLELKPRRLILPRLVREVLASFEAVSREKQLELSAEIPLDTKPVFADEQSVVRILTNLVGNAVKFTPARGRISVALATNQFQEKHSAITVMVADTGIGIPKAEQHRLFGKFEQISHQGTGRPKGTGLGLALTRQLVEMNGGRIWLESDEGEGAKFYFTLPVYDEQAAFVAEYRSFRANAHRFQRSGDRDPSPTVYLFVLSSIPDCGATDCHSTCGGVLPHFTEFLESLFPKPCSLVEIGTACSVVVFAPRPPDARRFETILASLRGASFFVEGREVRPGIRYARVEYRQGDENLLLPEDCEFATLYERMKPFLEEVK